jgi:hypothetical protein
MPSRDFIDSTGTTWRVWSTVPSGSTVLMSEFAGGWLTFECAGCLRRLAPIPPGWADAPPERLDLLCRAAPEVPRHTGPMLRLGRT